LIDNREIAGSMQCTVVPALRMIVVFATSSGALAVTLFLKIVEGVGELAPPPASCPYR